MEVTRHRPTAQGRVTVGQRQEPGPPRPGRPTQPLYRRSQYRWQPSGESAAALPPGFQLPLTRITSWDRNRRFLPDRGVNTFLLEASLAGAALLARRDSLNAERRFGYHALRLLFQFGPHLREHFGRSFKDEKDLYVPKAGRVGDAHILPESLGKGPQGGETWGPAELMERGREQAAAAGDSHPDPEACIRLGLLAAARLDPLDADQLSEAEARAVVRLALFDQGPAQAPVEGRTAEEVLSRLLGALERHLGDDDETFRHWCFEHIDNLVHQVAKKRRPGGPIPRASAH